MLNSLICIKLSYVLLFVLGKFDSSDIDITFLEVNLILTLKIQRAGLENTYYCEYGCNRFDIALMSSLITKFYYDLYQSET